MEVLSPGAVSLRASPDERAYRTLASACFGGGWIAVVSLLPLAAVGFVEIGGYVVNLQWVASVTTLAVYFLFFGHFHFLARAAGRKVPREARLFFWSALIATGLAAFLVLQLPAICR